MPKIIVVGEYLTQKDAEEGGPFRDGLGKMFKALMRERGLDPREALFTHVVMEPPKGRNSLFAYTGPKTSSIPGMKFVRRGHYLRAEFRPHVGRLWDFINHHQPNLVIAAGELALWALTSENLLKHARGRIHHGNVAIHGRKVLPVYAPRAIMADWSQRPILIADLEKAKRQAAFPEIVRPQRFIHLYPDLDDLEHFYQDYIQPSPTLDVDIETKGRMITCIGFAPSADRALVVPFFDESHKDGNYWRTQREEYIAWQWVKRMLRLPKSVCGQNYQYDMQYLWREMGIKNPSFADDTMLMHHSLQPEMSKGLGFLASIYTDELPWKFMHKTAANARGAKKGDGDE